jgi:hypothetical protein
MQLLPVEIQAFPNPVGEHLNLKIKTKESGRYFLSIHDASGRQLQQKPIQLLSGENQEMLNMSSLAAGHYTVHLSDGKRVKTQQIVKR